MSLTRDRRYQKGNCFVMMPYGVKELPNGQKFDWEEHWKEVLEVTIAEAGMTPLRALDMYGPGMLFDRIWQGIQEAEVVIADLTGRNPNVLYELGLAHVIGKRILLLSMFPEDIPVDLSQFVQIPYNGTKTLQLAQTLKKNLQAARLQPPNEMMLLPFGPDGIQEISVTVLSVMPEFAMIKADDGRIGFLSAGDFSWTQIPKDLTKILQKDKRLNGAFVVDSNGQQKYSLAYKDSPWPKLEKEFPINSTFNGVVMNVREGTGAWVNMSYGIQGFIPYGQIPRGLMARDEVKARVLEINSVERKVKLQFIDKIHEGQMPPDPSWPFHKGQVHEGCIDKVVPDRGFALVKIEHEGRFATGILLKSNMTLMLRDRLFNQDLQVGDPVAVEILSVDPINKKLVFHDRPSSDTPATEPEAELVRAH
jgi:small subunit ribosomal protein S1